MAQEKFGIRKTDFSDLALLFAAPKKETEKVSG